MKHPASHICVFIQSWDTGGFPHWFSLQLSHFLHLPQSFYGLWNLALRGFLLKSCMSIWFKTWVTSANTAPQLSLHCSDQSPDLIQHVPHPPASTADVLLSQKPPQSSFRSVVAQQLQRHNLSSSALLLGHDILTWLPWRPWNKHLTVGLTQSYSCCVPCPEHGTSPINRKERFKTPWNLPGTGDG